MSCAQICWVALFTLGRCFIIKAFNQMSPVISNKLIQPVFAGHYKKVWVWIWAAWCCQTVGCVTVSICPAGLPLPGNTSDWGPFLWHEAGPSAAVVLDFLFFHTCTWGPFIWHCCHCLVSGHHHKGCTIHSSFIHITAKSQNYIK